MKIKPYDEEILQLFDPNVEPITSFRLNYDFLSNFYIHEMVIDDVEWNSVEHYFQASKTTNEEDQETIRLAEHPRDAKKLGRVVNLRQDIDWDGTKVIIMAYALRHKFKNGKLKKLLLKTGMAELIEGNNWHDNEWGCCSCRRCGRIESENLLGILLMKVRSELRRGLDV